MSGPLLTPMETFETRIRAQFVEIRQREEELRTRISGLHQAISATESESQYYKTVEFSAHKVLEFCRARPAVSSEFATAAEHFRAACQSSALEATQRAGRLRAEMTAIQQSLTEVIARRQQSNIDLEDLNECRRHITELKEWVQRSHLNVRSPGEKGRSIVVCTLLNAQLPRLVSAAVHHLERTLPGIVGIAHSLCQYGVLAVLPHGDREFELRLAHTFAQLALAFGKDHFFAAIARALEAGPSGFYVPNARLMHLKLPNDPQHRLCIIGSGYVNHPRRCASVLLHEFCVAAFVLAKSKS